VIDNLEPWWKQEGILRVAEFLNVTDRLKTICEYNRDAVHVHTHA